MDITEKNVEWTIERALLAGGPDAALVEGEAHEPRLSYWEDERVFDSIIVITDRRVLDRQLQRAVRQFEQTLGVVEKSTRPPRPRAN